MMCVCVCVLTSVIAIPIPEMYKSVFIVVNLAKHGVRADAPNITDPTIIVDTLADSLTPVSMKIISL